MTNPPRPVVTVTRRLPPVAEAALAERFDVRLNADDAPLGAEGLRRALSTSDAVLCTVSDRLDASVLGRGAAPCPAPGQLRRGVRAHRPGGGDGARDRRHQHAGRARPRTPPTWRSR